MQWEFGRHLTMSTAKSLPSDAFRLFDLSEHPVSVAGQGLVILNGNFSLEVEQVVPDRADLLQLAGRKQAIAAKDSRELFPVVAVGDDRLVVWRLSCEFSGDIEDASTGRRTGGGYQDPFQGELNLRQGSHPGTEPRAANIEVRYTPFKDFSYKGGCNSRARGTCHSKRWRYFDAVEALQAAIATIRLMVGVSPRSFRTATAWRMRSTALRLTSSL